MSLPDVSSARLIDLTVEPGRLFWAGMPERTGIAVFVDHDVESIRVAGRTEDGRVTVWIKPPAWARAAAS